MSSAEPDLGDYDIHAKDVRREAECVWARLRAAPAAGQLAGRVYETLPGAPVQGKSPGLLSLTSPLSAGAPLRQAPSWWRPAS